MSAESTKSSANGVILEGDETPTLTAQKAVTIFEEPEHIPNDRAYVSSPHHSPKLHRANIIGKKMTGRPPLSQHSTSPGISRNVSPTLSRTISYLKLEDSTPQLESLSPNETPANRDDARKLLSQVNDWLNEEKAKRGPKLSGFQPDQKDTGISRPGSRRTEVDQDLALDKLERILNGFAFGLSMGPISDSKPKKSRSISSLKRGSIAKAYKRSSIQPPPASSDTEWAGDDINVPHVEASLDNTRTVAFTDTAGIEDVEAAQQRDLKHWEQFKRDIVRLTHTLKLRGWRRIPIEQGEIIIVERLSGALTNAVYVVKPPEEMPVSDKHSDTKPHVSKSKPMDLLLRIYGPQSDHLIDRDIELGILRRLARQKIGPRLLGYFTNGRFEEYFYATTLTAQDIRVPETMKQIAKRMRELHDGIDLLPSERQDGASMFKNWDKRVDRCEKVIAWLDLQVKREAEGHETPSRRYTRRGFVCGVEWPVFKKAFEKYRKWLTAECGGQRAVQRRLVFAHNDTQYGNLMKLDSPKASPLMQPANQHRQLVVIDFEYAGANTPGYELANHFTEWCYDYHDEQSFACNTKNYPTRQQQYSFVRTYVSHRPQYHHSASSTPTMAPKEKSITGDFMLDPQTLGKWADSNYVEEERARQEKMEGDIQLLLHETRLWRIGNAAEWVAWGIVQAKIPELDEPPRRSKTAKVAAAIDHVRERLHPHSDPLDKDVEASKEASKHDRPESRKTEEEHAEGDEYEEDEVGGFDYLAYSQDRAMLFWGDCLQMGIVKREQLPQSLLDRIKIVSY